MDETCGMCFFCRGDFIGDLSYCIHKSNVIILNKEIRFKRVFHDSLVCKYCQSKILKKSVNQEQFILVQDNSDAWYVIPFDRCSDWMDFLESDEIEQGCIPSYANRVGGHPCTVIFQNYNIQYVCCGLGGT
jgi:hypothetical protein